MNAAALALAFALSAGPRTELSLSCEGCFGMAIELDGAKQLQVSGLGAASVQEGKLGASREAALHDLAPGLHHLKVEVFTGPLNPSVFYDGPVYLRPGASMRLRVRQGALDDLAPPALPAPVASLPDGGAPPLAPASLVLRAEDDARCEIALDDQVRASLPSERVVEVAPIAPGLHAFEVRSLQGASLARGTLFLGAGEQAVAAVRCQTGAATLDSDPRALSLQVQSDRAVRPYGR